MTKQITASEEDLDSLEEEEKKIPQSRRGAKPLTQQKPKGATRFLFEKPLKSTRPVSVYLERVPDSESGETKIHLWYHTEDSQTIGREEISRINPRTEEEFTLGYDFTIDATLETVKKLYKERSGKTKFYRKDGNPRSQIGVDRDKIFHEDLFFQQVKAILGIKDKN